MFGIVTGQLGHRHRFQEILGIVIVTRQHIDTPQDVLIQKIRFPGLEADGRGIEQLGIDNRLEVHPLKRGVDQGAFDGLDSEQDILTGEGSTILEVRILPNFERIFEFVLGDLRACNRQLRSKF